jgi:hypothetical protein
VRVLVCGGRNYADTPSVFATLDEIMPTHVIHGAASGADHIAGMWATARKVPCTAYPADWRKHGKAAGPIRNQVMLESSKPDLVIAFPGGSGTADMIRRAAAAGIEVRRVP